ncbi:hypothetical protein QJS04_geneDACA018641 [Acorus gramineus]|uniref:Uncharacterized protein n=1 Tax=Acorus gramineus TaxID=55184 RepID=A0AAV9AH05_ACOGR|nr:hypothetical protein QJS04_geneDACA018641 [Acorus gramineus]
MACGGDTCQACLCASAQWLADMPRRVDAYVARRHVAMAGTDPSHTWRRDREA